MSVTDDSEPSQPRALHLGDWLVMPSRNEISRDNVEIRLEPKVMGVLMLLVENRPHVVTKTQLFETVWAGRFVVPGVLKRCISELRRALQDDARNPRYVATVPTRGYRLVCEVEEQTAAPKPAAAVQSDLVPYRGLDAFGVDHSSLFFGREAAISEVVEAMQHQVAAGRAFCLVTGPSGSGKSSLVQAGAIPALMKAHPGELTRYCVFRYADQPNALFRGLADSLLSVHALDSPDVVRAEGLAQLMRENPEESLDWLNEAISPSASAPTAQLILLIDQMEEIFSLGGITDEEREAFFHLLYTFARSGIVWVLATLRNDHYPQFAASDALRHLKQPRGHIELRPPGGAETGRIIREPARQAGLTFERSAEGVSLDDVLQNEAVAHPDLLPLLEFTLLELHKRRDENGMLLHTAFEDLGGLEGCVSRRAEQVFAQLPDPVRARLPSVLMQLVIDTGQLAGPSSQPVPIEQLASDEEARQLVSAFVEARLFSITLAGDHSQPIVRVTHEALLRHWARARDWLARNASQVRARAWLADQTRRWCSEGRIDDYLLPDGKPLLEAQHLLSSGIELPGDETELIKRSQRRASRFTRLKQAVVAIMVILTIVALSAAWNANKQREMTAQEATKSKQVSEFLTTLFEAADPGQIDGEALTVRQLLDRGAERIRNELTDQPRLSASLMNTMSEAYQGIGLYQQSRELSDEALGIHMAIGTENSVDAAQLRYRRAAVLTDQAEFAAAEADLTLVLKITESNLHPEALDVRAHALDELSVLHFMQDHAEQAQAFAEQALALRRSALPQEPEAIANSLNNLGAALNRIPDNAAAAHAFNEALAIYDQLPQGRKNFKQASTLNNLGTLAYREGDLASAESHFRRALAIRRTIYGPTHPDTAGMATNLASVLRDRGNWEQARTLYQDAYAILHNNSSINHPTTAHTAIKLCESQLVLNEPVDIEAVLLPAVATVTNVYGADNWRAARARSVHGAALMAIGATERARPLLLEAHQQLHNELGEDSRYTKDARARVQALNAVADESVIKPSGAAPASPQTP